MQEHAMHDTGDQARYAPGARVIFRDREWIVRRADSSDDGGYMLTVDGLSEPVSGKSAQFLTRLEEAADAIRVLDPAETRFEQDLFPGFEHSRLFIETQIRQITTADERIHLGHRAAMDPVPYQPEPVLQGGVVCEVYADVPHPMPPGNPPWSTRGFVLPSGSEE